MSVRAKGPAMLELVDEGAELEQLGSGFTFTEGPFWNPAGFFLFSDLPGAARRRWAPAARGGAARSGAHVHRGAALEPRRVLLVQRHAGRRAAALGPRRRGARGRQ